MILEPEFIFFSASETHVFLTVLCYIIIIHSFLRDGMYIENKKAQLWDGLNLEGKKRDGANEITKYKENH